MSGIQPHLLVIFGATGDLARRKLIPAFHHVLTRHGLKGRSRVLGVATSQLGDEEFRRLAAKALAEAGVASEEAESWCASDLFYQDLEGGMEGVAQRVRQLEEEAALPGNRIFYLALPPQVFPQTVDGLGAVGLNHSPGWTRLVVEKPFGFDLDSARDLNRRIHRHFAERQVYRIDHYLAKETVQNLLVFRFANPLFETAWNRDRVAAVEITVAETLGLEGRAKYFDRAGMIRDVVQNHVMQLVALVGMEPPVRMEAEAIRDEKVKLLRSILPVDPAGVVRGRYTAGEIDGETVPGYLEEPGVADDSDTETFASLTLRIDNWRWKGVPFRVRAGKRMGRRLTQVMVAFREPPVSLFPDHAHTPVHGNALFVTLQPDEGFDLCFDVKTPGEDFELVERSLRFRYADEFAVLPDAYETLLVDLLMGDRTLFVRSDEVEEAWRILAPALTHPHPPLDYPAGSWGP